MSDNKSVDLIASEDAASKNFSTENQISGSCASCKYEVLLHYHYDDDKPVPNAPFLLIDSNHQQTSGVTDKNGLCLINSMPSGPYEVLFEEGSDEFTPKETVADNPVLQANLEYARLAGEYFTLFIVLRKEGLLEYDADDSSDDHVEVDTAGFMGGHSYRYRLNSARLSCVSASWNAKLTTAAAQRPRKWSMKTGLKPTLATISKAT